MLETFKVSETEEYSSKYYKTIMTTIKIYECSFIITWQKALNNNMKNIQILTDESCNFKFYEACGCKRFMKRLLTMENQTNVKM